MSGSGLFDFDGNLSVHLHRNNTTNVGDFDWKKQFAEISIDTGLSSFRTAYIAMAALTIIICGTIVYAQLRSWRQLRDVSNFTVFHCLLADLMNGVVLMVSLWIIGRPTTVSTFNEVYCSLAWTTTWSSYGWSSWSILLVAYQRYDSITRPFHSILTLRRALAVVVAIWLGNIIIAITPFTGIISEPGLVRFPDNKTGICIPFRDGVSVQRELIYTCFSVTLTAFLPLVATAFFFTSVVAAAWRSLRLSEERALQFSGMQNAAHRHTTKLLKSRGFQCIMGIILSRLIVVTPFQVFQLTKTSREFPGETAMNAVTMTYIANFVINSTLYVIWLKSVRLQLAKLFCFRLAHTEIQERVVFPHTSSQMNATNTAASRPRNQGGVITDTNSTNDVHGVTQQRENVDTLYCTTL